jgi:hypothetical protein
MVTITSPRAALNPAHRPDELRPSRGGLLDVLPGIVAAAVVDDEDFEAVVRINGGHDRFDRLQHHWAFVIRGNDDGELRGSIECGRRKRVVSHPDHRAKDEQQRAHDDP